MSNCAIYEKDSDEIRHFIKDCLRHGNDYFGSNKRVTGIKSHCFDVLWTEDDANPIYDQDEQIGWDKKVSDLTPGAENLSIQEVSREDFIQALKERKQIADLTYQQVEDYVNSKVIDLPSARAYLIKLSKVVLGITKMMDKK